MLISATEWQFKKVTFYLEILTLFRTIVSLYFAIVRKKKSELWDKKSQLPFYLFFQWQKQASIINSHKCEGGTKYIYFFFFEQTANPKPNLSHWFNQCYTGLFNKQIQFQNLHT